MLNCYPLGFYSPATLVKDAQRHGVAVRPIDVQSSAWKCALEADGGVRLGLRYVEGLRQAAGERIASAAPFRGIADLAQRAGLQRDELDRLAEVGACASLGLSRRGALWQAAALGGGLLAGVSAEDRSPLPEMSDLEQTLADYRCSGLTVNAQLMAHYRADLRRRGILSAEELRRVPDGGWARTAGVVIVRQRPGTARGILFLTLEDETGMSNAIVMPDVFLAHRSVVQTAGMLLVEGPLQNQDGVIHVRARRFQRLDAAPGALPPSRDFH
jgi:error-prone DNA polymerase